MLGNPAFPLLWSVTGDAPDPRSLSAWCAYTGQSEEMVKDWGWLGALPPIDWERIRNDWQEAVRLQRPITFTYRIRRQGEEYQSFKALHVPLLNEKHQLQAWFVFFVKDPVLPPRNEKNWELQLIHSLIFAQEAHSEALARTFRLEAVFESITDGIIVCDYDGNILQSNSAARRLLHLERHPEYLTLPFHKRIPQMKLFDEHGQTLPAEQWPIVRILRGEDLLNGHTEDFHVQLIDGQDSYLNFSGAPLRDRQHHIIGAVLVIHDVSERHLLENRIRRAFRILLSLAELLVNIPERQLEKRSVEEASEAQLWSASSFRALGEYLTALTCKMMEYQGVSISLIDEDGVLHMVAISGSTMENRADYYKKYAGVPLSNILDQDAIALLRRNEVAIRELALHVSDTLIYTILLAPMIVDGRLVGVLSVEKREQYTSYTCEEISLTKAIAKFMLLVMERERVQRNWVEAHASELTLREANRRFDEFLSIASHELRTPLAGIKGNLQLALRRLKALRSNNLPETNVLLDKLAKMQEFLQEAEDRANVQNRMISDLLDVSRIQANKLELVMGSCDLAKIVRDAVKDQRYNTPARTIILQEKCDEQLTVIGDADRLGQVVHNYLSNALKYSPDEQPVFVSIERVAQCARVEVHDQGPGLTPEEQKRVWERFYRVKGIPSHGGSTPGLGLGLHICRTIVEAHHGQLGLESAPGKGCVFWFSLPLAQPGVTLSEKLPDIFPRQVFDVPTIL